jgi:histidinol phosphatase-like enzyme
MAIQAKNDFPAIDFSRSLIAGDSTSDMIFGKTLGMKTALIRTKNEDIAEARALGLDFETDNLLELMKISSIFLSKEK